MAAAACLTVLAVAPGASAQGYSVYADCDRSDGWTAQGDDNYGAYRSCEGGWLRGLRTLVTPHGDGRYANGTAAFTFRAPDGTKIVGLQWSGNKYYGVSSAGWLGGGWAFRTGMFGDGFRNIDGEADCYTHNFGACFSGAQSEPNARSVPDHHVGGLNESNVGFYTQCTPAPNNCPAHSDGISGHNFTRAGLAVSNMRVDLRDDWDPSVGVLVGTGGWQRGVVGVRFDSWDNSGVARTAVRLGNDTFAADRGRGCDFYRPIPCENHYGENGDHSIDTRGLADGGHVVAPEAWDAAGRWTRGGWQNLYVDNNAPNAPSGLSIDGGEGWSSSNSRTIRWTNPDGQAAPINGAQVQVCRTGTSDCRTSDHGGGGINAVGGIGGFAGPGEYTVRVSLKDEAGNHNAGNLSNGVQLRFDNLAPGDALPRNANGWLNAVERAAYEQDIELKPGAFVPVSGIKGYSVTANGTDPDATVEATGNIVKYPINNLPEGANTIKARAVSNAGLPSPNAQTAMVRVDLSRPTASVEGVPDPAKWQNKPVDLELRGADQADLSGMAAGPDDTPVEDGAYIAYRIDGGELHKVRGASAPVTVGEEGEHTVTYYAVDFAGNESETKTVQFKIDRTNPTAGANSDAVDPGAWQRESVSVTLTGDDGQGKAGMDPAPADQPVENGAHLVYRLNASNVQRARGASATFRVDADGDHEVTYYAIDGAGNESEHKTVRFRVDKTAPSPVVIDQLGLDKRRLEVEAGDATSGVGEVQIGLRRVGSIGQVTSLRRQAKKDLTRYRRMKLRGTRRTGNRLVDCHKKRGKAKRNCLAKRRKQLERRHRIASLGEGWRMVPATREGDKWVAYVPNDRSLVEGVYQLQAVAQDQAGNESSTDKFRSGAPAIVDINDQDQPNCCTPDPDLQGSGGGVGGGNSPIDLGADLGTIDTKIAAGAVKKVKVKRKLPKYCKKPKTKAQKKKCAKARKQQYRSKFVSKIKVKFGRKAKINGSLTTAAGAPVADGTIDVITLPTAVGHVPRVVGAVRTDSTGAFSYTAPAGSSRKVTFRFRGLGDYRRSEGTVDVQVPGSATLKSSEKRVKNGDSVTFSGKLLGKPLPARGKVVDLQAFYRGKWRTFATPRANKKGHFKFRYRFEATRTTTTYKFRARLRAESAYSYELGYSKVVSVRVRGR